MDHTVFPNGSAGQESACHAGDAGATGSTPGWGKSPEEEMATHSSILAGHLPWIVETARLWSTGSQRAKHNWSTWVHMDYTLHGLYMHVCAILLWRMHVSTIMGTNHSASNLLYVCWTHQVINLIFHQRRLGFKVLTGLCQWGCIWGELQGAWFFKGYVLAPGERPNIAAIPRIQRLP